MTKYSLDVLLSFLEKRVCIIDDKGKEWHGQCWGVYSGVENEDEYGVVEDSLELLHDGMSTVFYASEIQKITITD